MDRLAFLEEQYPKLKQRLGNIRKQYRQLQQVYIVARTAANEAWNYKLQANKNWRALFSENTELRAELAKEKHLTRQTQASTHKVAFFCLLGFVVGYIARWMIRG